MNCGLGLLFSDGRSSTQRGLPKLLKSLFFPILKVDLNFSSALDFCHEISSLDVCVNE